MEMKSHLAATSDNKIIISQNDLILIELSNRKFHENKVYLPNLRRLYELMDKDKNCKVDKNKLESFYMFDKLFHFPENPKIDIDGHIVILIALGILNVKNKETKFMYTKFSYDNFSEKKLIGNENFYLSYYEYMLNAFKKNLISKIIKNEYLDECKNILAAIGIEMDEEFYSALKKNVLLKSNKILILLAPGDNLWFKSNKKCIGYDNYQRKYEGREVFVFYNWDFLDILIKKLGNHKRCKIGLISSLNEWNLNENFELIKKYVNENYEKSQAEKIIGKFVLFNENHHDILDVTNSNENISPNIKINNIRKIFKRNLDKVKDEIKINKNQIIILDSEKEKSKGILENFIFLNTFSEEIILVDKITKDYIKFSIEKLMDYLLKMLNSDETIIVQNYLRNNPFN